MLEIVRGQISKPAAVQSLIKKLEEIGVDEGIFYLGYPILASIDGPQQLDCILVSRAKGIVLFHLIEGVDLPEDINELVDNAYNNTISKLQAAKSLVEKRRLLVDITVITYAPRFNSGISQEDSDYIGLVSNKQELESKLNLVNWSAGRLYEKLLSEIQSVSSLRRGKKRSDLKKENSRGSKLKRLEDAISTLDQDQSKAFIETVDGVQRIRGLAGSGKTIVLARKIAYLHSLNPDWNIAVTFQTRSLKNQLERLITIFCIEQSKEEPDWDRIHILHAWGGTNSAGIYYRACIDNSIPFYTVGEAKRATYSGADIFSFVCVQFLKEAQLITPAYDLILVDEAQDFSPAFLNLCYQLLTKEKRLVYAYDELQNLNETSMESPEEIWGKDANDEPVVSLRSGEGEPQKDNSPGTGYRNPGPRLTTAHA